MKKRRLTFLILTVAVIVVVVGAIVVKSYLEANLKQLSDLTIQNANLSLIADGTYEGSFGSFPVSAEVEVTVKNNLLTAINLVKHNHGQGAAAEVITDKVVESQTLAVDTITGATYSSIVILKAIEDALNSALE